MMASSFPIISWIEIQTMCTVFTGELLQIRHRLFLTGFPVKRPPGAAAKSKSQTSSDTPLPRPKTFL